MCRLILPLAVAITTLHAAIAAADVAQLTPAKDNTLIQQSNPASQLSNGQGDIFVGRTNQDGQGPATISIRRGLIQFDIAGGIPAGSTITGVTLTVREVTGLNGDPTVNLHRVLQDWGEGNSFFNGGGGAPAADGDATWLYTFFDASNPTSSPAWTTPGGDYSPTASGSTVISDDLGANQFFTWSSSIHPQMVVDVQGWLDNPASNFGWLLIGDESRGASAKRINSGESAFPPLLEITYTAVPEVSPFAIAIMGSLGLFLGRFTRRAHKKE